MDLETAFGLALAAGVILFALVSSC